MGTMESLKFLVSSRYIRDLATLVVAYGISINLVEVTWKSKLKAQVIINKMVDLVFVSVLYRAMLLYAFSLSHESLQTAVS
jgi:ATP/ADP translocase